MKKETQSKILTALIIICSLLTVIMLVMIVMRGAEPVKRVDKELPAPISSNSGMLTAGESMGTGQSGEQEAVEIQIMLGASISANTGVNLRTGPGKDYDVVLSAESGQFVEVELIYDNGWAKIKYGSREGYISTDFLSYGIITKKKGFSTGFEEMSLEKAVSVYREANPEADTNIFVSVDAASVSEDTGQSE
ncbi:MAG: SH3 domain-containing protein [Lachnospiraceae bacterium]|nr:SH3 domain-containing protein [Lachnospiraceae bacterium]